MHLFRSVWLGSAVLPHGCVPPFSESSEGGREGSGWPEHVSPALIGSEDRGPVILLSNHAQAGSSPGFAVSSATLTLREFSCTMTLKQKEEKAHWISVSVVASTFIHILICDGAGVCTRWWACVCGFQTSRWNWITTFTFFFPSKSPGLERGIVALKFPDRLLLDFHLYDNVMIVLTTSSLCAHLWFWFAFWISPCGRSLHHTGALFQGEFLIKPMGFTCNRSSLEDKQSRQQSI